MELVDILRVISFYNYLYVFEHKWFIARVMSDSSHPKLPSSVSLLEVFRRNQIIPVLNCTTSIYRRNVLFSSLYLDGGSLLRDSAMIPQIDKGIFFGIKNPKFPILLFSN